ncbi:MAG: pyruvate ferredoxin oxidoreductase [Calditrichaeota bacterium]|nr:MAG: pyruvate ferredoxin oxidoreductase [Calditrichota bacterium]MBL1205138.1 pyruvate ferredoxin oxidoreductase [Calditrichota bacterium]NOG44968.1 pyruvate ferredoxin oxidoreductase [Calditrichota bacterium]
MIEIRMHGRGGQGAVIACKILANALFREGKFAQSFPAFGVERRGAPVMAFTRIDNKPIHLRTEIYEPDHLIILDASLLQTIDVTIGLKPAGKILINSGLEPSSFKLPQKFDVMTIDANSIAVKHGLGTRSTPIVNTAILGAFSKFTKIIGVEAIEVAIHESVPIKKKANVLATHEAYETLKIDPIIHLMEHS